MSNFWYCVYMYLVSVFFINWHSLFEPFLAKIVALALEGNLGGAKV